MGKLVIGKIQPATGYLLVEPEEVQRQTAGGIVLPESHEEKPQQGKVLAVGGNEVLESGAKRVAPAKKGEEIIYRKWGGAEVKVDGKEYCFLKFEDVLAVVK